MEKMTKFRKMVRSIQLDHEKRRDFCDNFTLDLLQGYKEETRCCCCGKFFKPGDRRFHYQGSDGDLCDGCFCDFMEADIYRDCGLNFKSADGGGGTIWVSVEGEKPIWEPR